MLKLILIIFLMENFLFIPSLFWNFWNLRLQVYDNSHVVIVSLISTASENCLKSTQKADLTHLKLILIISLNRSIIKHVRVNWNIKRKWKNTVTTSLLEIYETWAYRPMTYPQCHIYLFLHSIRTLNKVPLAGCNLTVIIIV